MKDRLRVIVDTLYQANECETYGEAHRLIDIAIGKLLNVIIGIENGSYIIKERDGEE